MKPMNIFDLHCDTLMPVYIDGYNLKSWNGHINLDKLRKGGSMVQCFAIYIPTNRSAEYHNVHEGPYEYWKGCVDAFDKEMAANADVIRQVRCVADIEKNVKEGKMSALLTIENGVALDGKIERVQEFYDRGARMIGLTWNYENCVATPASKDATTGLKPFGREAVREMQRLKMAVDVSHLNEKGFYELLEMGIVPLASHSCCRKLCDHVRNLTDDQLKELFRAGGYVGVNFYPLFLRKEGKADLQDVCDHVIHMLEMGGEGKIGFGSDFDGITTKITGLEHAGQHQNLVNELLKYYSEDDVRGFAYQNFLNHLPK